MSDVTDLFVASNARVGYGAQLKVGQGDSPETFISVPMVNAITPGDITTEIADVTHLRSPGRHREKRGTIRDSGAFAFEADYDPNHGAHKESGGDGFNSTHSLMYLARAVARNNFKMTLPDPDDPTTSDFELDVEGTVTKYQIGGITLTDPTKVLIEITPLRDYFRNP